MTSQRAQRLGMTPEEVDTFLSSHWLMVLGTNNSSGRPHLVTMGYTRLDGMPIFTSYRKAQKTVNLRRDNRVSCLIEDVGEAYSGIQGVLLYGTAEIIDDHDVVVDFLGRISHHMSQFSRPLAPYDSLEPEQVAAKRVAVKVHIDRVVSWDHGRLNGAY